MVTLWSWICAQLLMTIGVFDGLDFTWQDEFYSSLENSDLGAVDSAGFVNIRTGWNSEQNWNLTLYVENVFDEEAFAARGTGDGVFVNVAPSYPRTAGVDISDNF